MSFFKIFISGLEVTIKAKIEQELTQVAVGKQLKPWVNNEFLNRSWPDLLICFGLIYIIYNDQLSCYLYQSGVPSIVQILKKALFPITSKRSWSTLWTWGTLTSASTRITLVSRVTSWTCFTFVPRWTCRACRWSRDTCWSRGSRTSWDAWNSWCTETPTMTTGTIRWSLLRNTLNEKFKNSFRYKFMINWLSQSISLSQASLNKKSPFIHSTGLKFIRLLQVVFSSQQLRE